MNIANTRNTNGDGPALIIEYHDPLEGFHGWLVIDPLDHGLAAGGMRVCSGLKRKHICAMARNMTLKMRMADLGLDGAKCGIDYDPAGPGKEAAMQRFIAAISPYIKERYSMGPDLNVGMDELQKAANGCGIDSVKMAVARAMGWDLAYFSQRYAILKRDVGGMCLGMVRAGYGVAGSVLACLDHLGIRPDEACMTVQGAGTLARGTLHGLKNTGLRLVAVSDAEKTLYCENGIDIDLVLSQATGILPESLVGGEVKRLGREAVCEVGADLLLPLAVEGVIDQENAGRVRTRAVVPGANLAVSPEGYEALFSQGILTMPDFLAGAGGSISMEGLFAPKEHPEPEEVLTHTINRSRELSLEVIERSERERVSPYKAALAICREREKRKSGYFRGREG